MSANQAGFSVATMYRVLGLSESAYYASRQRPPSARSLMDSWLLERIQASHVASRGASGAPRVHADLAAEGIRVGEKRVARLMKNAGLEGISPRKWVTVRPLVNPVVRLLSWNLHGVAVPGRATLDQQHRAWAHMRDLGADIVLAQEIASRGIPPWARDEWTIVQGERGACGKSWHSGSVIAAKPGLNLRPRPDLLADPWIARMYDFVLVGEIDLPGGSVSVASVHAITMPVQDWLKGWGTLTLSEDEIAALKRPGCPDEPYYSDFAFAALDRHVAGGRFLIGGDWNTCRKVDAPRSPAGTAFFERAAAQGLIECHRGPEEPSFLGRGTPTYQLDHAFCDPTTAATVMPCRVVLDDVVRAVSDHAPLVVELGA